MPIYIRDNIKIVEGNNKFTLDNVKTKGKIDSVDIVPNIKISNNTAETIIETFNYTGSYVTWDVPKNVNEITAYVWGAGGGGMGYGSRSRTSIGGTGGFVKAKINVTNIDSLNLIVAGGGVGSTSTGSIRAGGYLNGGDSTATNYQLAGSGGGLAGIFKNDSNFTITNGELNVNAYPFIIAGSGGGAGDDGGGTSGAGNGGGGGSGVNFINGRKGGDRKQNNSFLPNTGGDDGTNSTFKFSGGDGVYAGGSGAGYYGGVYDTDDENIGLPGGGGGSSYWGGENVTYIGDVPGINGSITQPDYSELVAFNIDSNIAIGASTATLNAGNGLIVLEYVQNYNIDVIYKSQANVTEYTTLECDSTNLVAHYKFDGDLLDSSGNENHITSVTGTIDYHSDIKQIGQSSLISGNEYVEITALNALTAVWSGAFTISFWMYPTTSSKDYLVGGWDNSGSANPRGGWYLRASSGYLAWLVLVNNSFITLLTTDDPVTSNNWYHVAISSTGNTFSLSLNGVNKTINHTAPLSTPSEPLANRYIGVGRANRWSGTGYDYDNFGAYFDDLRIYDKVLTNTEVYYLANNMVIDNNYKLLTFKYEEIVYDFSPYEDLASWTNYASSFGATTNLTSWLSTGPFIDGSTNGYLQLELPDNYNTIEIVYNNPYTQGYVAIYIDTLANIASSLYKDRAGPETTKIYKSTYSQGDYLKIIEEEAAIIGKNLIIKLSNGQTEYELTFNYPTTCDVLVVGGGGGGGYYGGGGGAGAILVGNNIELTNNTTYTLLVGGGGRGSINDDITGFDGTSSTFKANNDIIVEALGGGGGGSLKLVDGLYFEWYSGYYSDNVNWFSSRTPIMSGYAIDGTNIGTFSNNSVSASAFNSYSFEWYGYFKPAVSGTHIFYTSSDDASYCWVGSTAISGYSTSNALINNGGTHGMQERNGSINLTANYYYPIRILFGENSSGDNMVFSFTPPGGSRTYNGQGYYYNTFESTSGKNGGSGGGGAGSAIGEVGGLTIQKNYANWTKYAYQGQQGNVIPTANTSQGGNGGGTGENLTSTFGIINGDNGIFGKGGLGSTSSSEELLDHTGNGGDGGYEANKNGKYGSSGIIVIKYKTIADEINYDAQWIYNNAISSVYFYGNVGIGNNANNYKLNIDGDISISGEYYKKNNTISLNNWQTNGTDIYRENGNVGIDNPNPVYKLQVNGDIYAAQGGVTGDGSTTWSVNSDRRIKDNIELASYEECYENLKKMNLFKFNYKEGYNTSQDINQLGFIAQEIETQYPKSINTYNNIKRLNVSQINYNLFGAMKYLINEIEELKTLTNTNTSNISI